MRVEHMSKIQEKFSIAKEQLKKLDLELIVNEKEDKFYNVSIRDKQRGRTYLGPGGWTKYEEIEDLSQEDVYEGLRQFVHKNVL